MDTIKTIVHTYFYGDGESDPKHAELVRKLNEANGPDCFAAAGSTHSAVHTFEDGQEVELELAHVFSNQWNTACGKRAFDWYEPIDYVNGHRGKCRGGYWLEQTDEMREIRRQTLVCGYCGHQKQADVRPKEVFCGKCLDSEYLKREELHLLRWKAAGLYWPKREPLTENEEAVLLPAYDEAQGLGVQRRDREVIARSRQRIEDELVRDLSKAKTDKVQAHHSHEVKTWLMDHGFGKETLDNLIYYSHTERWAFGWRGPVGAELKSRLLDVLSEAPFDYDFTEG